MSILQAAFAAMFGLGNTAVSNSPRERVKPHISKKGAMLCKARRAARKMERQNRKRGRNGH